MSLGLWVSATRPRTLPASVAPVAVGASAAWQSLPALTVCPAIYPAPPSCALNAARYDMLMTRFWPVTIGCALVALSLQIAVNFANDYSDGVRGADAIRGGDERITGKPTRLVANGVAPSSVLLAAAISAALACVAGLAVIVATGEYWFIALGVLCLLAGWLYTGGRHPYGYMGLGELGVFVFFGLVATLGTQYLLLGEVNLPGWFGAVTTGLLSSALLMVNNLRDIDDDRASGKRTLAVRIGPGASRVLFAVTIVVPSAFTAFLALTPAVYGIRSMFGWDCGVVHSSPPAAAGGQTVSESGTDYICAPAQAPHWPVWPLAAVGLVCLALAVVALLHVLRGEYPRALMASGLTLIACAGVWMLGSAVPSQIALLAPIVALM